MKMVVLVENSSRCRLCAEHGLSVYIEYEGKTYLLDTGATALFAENAKELGIDLSKVDTAFLSHAHYDHSVVMASLRTTRMSGVKVPIY